MEPSAGSGRSDWGLFGCTRRVLEVEGADRALECRFWLEPPLEGCDGPVSILKPIEGAGTELFHGDFARRMSPSCEALAWHLLHHRGALANRRILELGSGLGFTGLAVAAWAAPAHLQLTDGDPVVVQTLRRSLELNRGAFGDTSVDAQVLYWETAARAPQEEERYDIIIAGDVVYLDVSHAPLLATMRRWLKRGGSIYLAASKRNGSLDRFVELARATFPSVRMSADYEPEVVRTFSGMKCYPWLVRMSPDVDMEAVPRFAMRVVEQSKERLAQARQQAVEEAQCRAAAENAQRRRRDELAARHRGEHLEAEVGRSDWGLFACERRLHDPGGDPEARALELRYWLDPAKRDCEGAISLVKPLDGGGLDLAFGDGARRISPCAEALAWFLLRRRRGLRGRRVLELGAGLGLSGLTAAVWSEAASVRLTDGDPAVVRTLQRSVELTQAACGETEVSAEVLLWEADKRTLPEGLEPFDVVIAADVVDAEEGFSALLSTLRRWVKPSGTVFVCGSRRAGSLDRFLQKAALVFPVVQPMADYEEEVSRRFAGMACFPVLVKMATPDLQAIAPESGLAAFGQAAEEAKLRTACAERRARREARRRRAAKRAHRRQRDRLVAQREERQRAVSILAEMPPPLQESPVSEDRSSRKQASKSSGPRGGRSLPSFSIAAPAANEEEGGQLLEELGADSCSCSLGSTASSSDESSGLLSSSRVSERSWRKELTPSSRSTLPPAARGARSQAELAVRQGAPAPRSASLGSLHSRAQAQASELPSGEASSRPPRLPLRLQHFAADLSPRLGQAPRRGGCPLLRGRGAIADHSPLAWPRAVGEKSLPTGCKAAKAASLQRASSVDSVLVAQRALAPLATVNLCLPPLAMP